MKKILLSMVACAAMSAQAQNVTVVKQDVDGDFAVIPAAYTTDQKSLFMLNQGTELKIMDGSFGDLKTIPIESQTFSNYSLVYDAKFVFGRNYEESSFNELPGEDCWTNDMPMRTEEEILEFWKWNYGDDTKIMEWNADTMLVYNGIYEWSNGREMNASYYHRTNPKRWASCSVRWKKNFTGEYETPVKEDESEESCYLYNSCHMWDVDYQDNEYHYLDLSQTLFNSDEKFEYFKPVYETQLASTYINDYEGTKTEQYYPRMVGFSVVQEDGTVLATVRVSEGNECDRPTVIKSYDGIYFLVEEHNPGSHWKTVIYKMDASGTGISRVKEYDSMRAYPNPAHRSETVTIDVPENVQNGSLVVSNSAGMTLQTVKLNGQRQASVSTARMSSGVYNVTLVSGGKRLQTSRIIVK